MNFLLTLNKKLVISVLIISIILIVFFLFTKYYLSLSEIEKEVDLNATNADIIEPKFAINSVKEKIFVTASEGNFIDTDNVLLRNNVKFQSKNFSIETDNVIFNRKEQTAKSDDLSLFKSKKTTIYSEGFDIYDNGNKIIFYGNVKLTLK